MDAVATERARETHRAPAEREAQDDAAREPEHPVRVLMVHSDELILVGARALLREQSWVVDCLLATSPEMAMRLTREHRPDVAVIRGCAPDGGPTLASRLTAAGVTVIAFGDPVASRFVRTVRRAASGDTDGLVVSASAVSLSAREVEVLQHLATGASNGEIGRRLFLSPHTVKQHVRRICAKLSARNRVEAIARAQAIGALDGARPPTADRSE